MAKIKGFLQCALITACVGTLLLLLVFDRIVFNPTSKVEKSVSDLDSNRHEDRIVSNPTSKVEKSVSDLDSNRHEENPPESYVDKFQKLHTLNDQLPRTNVIILTYMRSGSTLTGEIFGQHPDVFYVFEPMHTLKWELWSKRTRLSFFDQTSREVKSEKDFANTAKDIADGFLRCHPTKIDIATLSQHHLGKSKDTIPYKMCLKSKPGVLKMLDCLPILQKQCLDSNVSVIKTIRFPMEAVETMMKSNPSLKVIHLVRDPRPTIKSQISFGRDTWSNLDPYSKEHCLRVQKDLQVTKRLMESHPDKTKLLLYEDLVVHPSRIAQDLFSFVGLAYTRETERFVQSKTNGTVDEHCVLCTQRLNSSLSALQWRKELDFNRAQVIDANCKAVYQMLGYLPVNTATELKDLSKSLKIERNL